MNPSEDLGKARLETTSLHRRIEELERELQHAQLIANQRPSKSSQDYATQIENLSAEISRQSAALQERETRVSRQGAIATQRNRIFDPSNPRRKIRFCKTATMSWSRQNPTGICSKTSLRSLESATNQNEAAVSEETEQMRTEFQAQLALLQAELSQKEWALEEQCASASGLDQQYREQIEVLNQKLAQAEAHAQQDPDPFVIDTDKMNGEQHNAVQQYREVIATATQGSKLPLTCFGITALAHPPRSAKALEYLKRSGPIFVTKKFLVMRPKKDQNFKRIVNDKDRTRADRNPRPRPTH